MVHGVLYECPRSLVESWWIKLEERGFPVELKTPPTIEVPAERDGVRYRGGSVQHEGAGVRIWGSPGAYSPQSPLYGKHVLVIEFRKSAQGDARLARMIGDVLVQLGALEVTREWAERVRRGESS